MTNACAKGTGKNFCSQHMSCPCHVLIGNSDTILYYIYVIL